ncbi:MAG: hypothetical protein EON95_20340, partial [Caulobacteraceae bacterium]
MDTTATFAPSLAALGRQPHLRRPPGRLTVHAAITVAVFVSYILHRLTEGGLSTLFAVVGVGACGWAWLLARALFDPAGRDARWPRIVALIVAAAGAAGVLAPADSLLARVAAGAYALSGSAALMLTFVEPFHRFRSDLD